MNDLSISEAAGQTGFTTSALRFYEQSGLVKPHRTAAGYRMYSDADVETLRFVSRAKGFGLTLEEITDLLSLLDTNECGPVQDRLRQLAERKVLDAQDKIAELIAFTAELNRLLGGLSSHTPEGPCDDDCGCTADVIAPRRGVMLVPVRASNSDEPIACTLAADSVGDRMSDWQAMIGKSTQRHDVDGGSRFVFGDGVDIGALAVLASAEQDCCRFFSFTINIGFDGVTLDVTGPPDAQPIIESMGAWAKAAS
jgi:DNA-binding transcriptional MerR regulator